MTRLVGRKDDFASIEEVRALVRAEAEALLSGENIDQLIEEGKATFFDSKNDGPIFLHHDDSHWPLMIL